MTITKYHGKYVEIAVYVFINALFPLISQMFQNFDPSTRFYLSISLFTLIIVMNFCRAFTRGYVRLVYWVSIFLNFLSFVSLGMVSYIYAVRMLPYLFLS